MLLTSQNYYVYISHIRAEQFEISLQKAKEQEKLFEEEREKWIKSFEKNEKSTTTTTTNNKENKSIHFDNYDMYNKYSAIDLDDTLKSDYLLPESKKENLLFAKELQGMKEKKPISEENYIMITAERDSLRYQLSTMKHQYEIVIKDKEKLLRIIENNTNKIKFQDDIISKKIINITNNINSIQSLENQIVIQNNELNNNNMNLMSISKHNAQLKDEIHILSNHKLITSVSTTTKASKATDKYLLFDEIDKNSLSLQVMEINEINPSKNMITTTNNNDKNTYIEESTHSNHKYDNEENQEEKIEEEVIERY